MEDIQKKMSEQKSPHKAIFALAAFGFSILTITLCIAIVELYVLKKKELFGISDVYILRITLISVVLGLGLSIVSFSRKEKLKFIKFVGTLLNFLLFTIIAGAIAYALLID